MEQKAKEPFFQAFRRELREIKSYYLTPAQRESLEKRSFLGRFFVSTFYILKAFYLRLSPVRRVLFLLALFFMLSIRSEYQGAHYSVHFNLSFWSGVLLILLLLLELKDKMLIKDEILAAKAIQKSLIPQDQPRVAGFEIFHYYRPMNEVGGDLVDALELPDGNRLLVLADISGKGLPAALLMSKLQGFVQAFAPTTPFERLMNTINRSFFFSVPKQSFASMLLLLLKENASVVQVLNAGHLPPLFAHRGKFTRLPKGGMALGLSEAASYRAESLTLNEGDVLICFSDGLSEAFNRESEQFGEKRIEEIARAHIDESVEEIARAILHGVQTFMGDEKLADDLTLIVLKKKSAQNASAKSN